MMQLAILAQPARAAGAGLALSSCRKKGSEQRFPGGKSQGSGYKLSPARAMLKELVYPVRRREPVLVVPAAETPRETKHLSDLDNMRGIRVQSTMAHFYRGGGKEGVDPAGIIRRAVGEALVQYYPLAGRLREVEGGRLVVDCTGEGVLFVEADAEVRLAELEEAGLRPPFPCWEELLFDMEGSGGILNSPLLLIQVTRLLCGGFVLALRFNHTMLDGKGLNQFLNGVGEFARGLPSMTVTPVWSRELIQARSPLRPSFAYRLFKGLGQPPAPAWATEKMVVRSFTFGASDILAIKKSLPRGTAAATTFEALAAFLWCARTAALQVAPGEDATLVFASGFRRAGSSTRLPKGYYGNAILPSMLVVADARALLGGGSIGHAVELMRMHKAALTPEYVQSLIDELVLLKDRRSFVPGNLFMLSDLTSFYHRLDMGWGKPVIAAPSAPSGVSFLLAVEDRDGREGAVCVPVVLTEPAMVRFEAEVERLLFEFKQQQA